MDIWRNAFVQCFPRPVPAKEIAPEISPQDLVFAQTSRDHAPQMLALPSDAFIPICIHLSLREINCLATASRQLVMRLPDELWRHEVEVRLSAAETKMGQEEDGLLSELFLACRFAPRRVA